jgi:tetratricopeptide (TPR) repeat protein
MKGIINFIFLLMTGFLWSQISEKDVKKIIKKAEKAYANEALAEAEANYRKAKNNENSQAVASYNMGNAIYNQKNTSESKFAYLQAIEKAANKSEKHKAYHNLGNVLMKQKSYQEAVEAYKNALRNNPTDDETRYNFALAKEYLKNNPPDPQGGGNDNKDQDQNQDKNQQQQPQDSDQSDGNGDKDQKEGDNKQDKPQEGDNKEDKKDQDNNPPQKQGMAKESLERLLEAVQNEEKKVQEKLKGEKIKGQPIKTDKDW